LSLSNELTNVSELTQSSLHSIELRLAYEVIPSYGVKIYGGENA